MGSIQRKGRPAFPSPHKSVQSGMKQSKAANILPEFPLYSSVVTATQESLQGPWQVKYEEVGALTPTPGC